MAQQQQCPIPAASREECEAFAAKCPGPHHAAAALGLGLSFGQYVSLITLIEQGIATAAPVVIPAVTQFWQQLQQIVRQQPAPAA